LFVGGESLHNNDVLQLQKSQCQTHASVAAYKTCNEFEACLANH
jgi:hypothetical protein